MHTRELADAQRIAQLPLAFGPVARRLNEGASEGELGLDRLRRVAEHRLLVTVVVLSAVVPTAIAERWFLPNAEKERHEERRHAPFPAEEYV